MVNIGSIIALVGLGYFVYGLIKSPAPTYPEYTPPPAAPTSPPPAYSVSTSVPRPPPQPTRPKYCTHCGQPLSLDIKFCESCGTRVE
jgi:hypothetical protein